MENITPIHNDTNKKKRGRVSKKTDFDKSKEDSSEIKIKKNLEIFKKPKQQIIKVKSNEHEKKSMRDLFEAKQVLLWGLNKVDSIMLNLYEKDFSKKTDKLKKEDKITIIKVKTKTTDTEYNPDSSYSIYDIEFLNKEYERIENELSNMSDFGDKFELLMDVQDKLSDLINDLDEQIKESDTPESNSNNDNTDCDDTEKNESDDILTTETKLKTKTVKAPRKKKLKPYYFIGTIPDGFREATQEEAILNKKVSWFGKNKVSRELYNIHNVTGTLFIPNLDPQQINFKILALKGKLGYYKREHEFHKISLGTGKLSVEQTKEVNAKINTISECYKKTYDVLNTYIECMKKNSLSSTSSTNNNKISVQSSESVSKSDTNTKIIKTNIKEKKNKSIKNQEQIN